MSAATSLMRNGEGIVLPAALLLGLSILIASQLDLGTLLPHTAPMAGPQTVTIVSRPYDYRASGDFLRGTATVDGPLVHVAHPPALEIMKYQVSAADYALCVADGACEKAEPRRKGAGDVPVTGVSFNDATRYAAWLSERTGQTWRLPTVEEWVFAAGSRAGDHALGVDTSSTDPAQRWLLAYRQEAAGANDGPAAPAPLGTFGVNEFGVWDLSAVVWEWTSTCTSRTALDAGDKALTHIQNCGARYLEGRHRTAMSTFVRDALGGGCSVGVPPDNFGFRLVRERTWIETIATMVHG